jgi:hypothetical protein
MVLIPVPKPPKSARDPNRRISALLISQVDHMQHAERRLPQKYRTDIYSHAIRTEGEAAQYIREVTEAIHQAHEDAELKRKKRAPKRRGIAIAAAAEGPTRKRAARAKTKKKRAPKRGRKT